MLLICAQMESCAGTASMLAEEFCQIVEGFVEVHTDLQAESMICGRNISRAYLRHISGISYVFLRQISAVYQEIVWYIKGIS